MFVAFVTLVVGYYHSAAAAASDGATPMSYSLTGSFAIPDKNESRSVAANNSK